MTSVFDTLRQERFRKFLGREVIATPTNDPPIPISGTLLKVWKERSLQWARINIHNIVGDPDRTVVVLAHQYHFELDKTDKWGNPQ